MIPFARPLPLAIAAMALLAAVKITGLAQGIAITTPALANSGAPPAPAAVKPAPSKPAPVTAEAPPPPPAEPPVSEAERAVLQDLRTRRTQLDSRAQSVETGEAMLAAAERRMTERVQELAAMQAKLEQLESSRRERDDTNWRGLVKTYETMRPRDAATILADMDGPVLLQVLDRMKEAKAAPILAALPPERARAATAQLAQWRSRGSASPTSAGAKE
ncbi:MAG: hypothetical protein NVSMB18_20760 [Acetobacteraceae bacterium]